MFCYAEQRYNYIFIHILQQNKNLQDNYNFCLPRTIVDFDYQSKNSQADSCNESAQLVVSANQSKDSLGIQSQVSLGNNIDNKEEGIEEDDARERIINKHPTMSRKRREEDAKEKEMYVWPMHPLFIIIRTLL